jgi:hypothetical protein
MKRRILVIISLIWIIAINNLYAQSVINNQKQPSLKNQGSVQFANDIIIDNNPAKDQQNIVMCSAFNGWLYAVYSNFDRTYQMSVVTILRSKDDGTTWSILLEGPFGDTHTSISRLDIIACGNDTMSLKFFIGYCIHDSISSYKLAYVARYNGITGIAEGEILKESSLNVEDLALASDNLFPATGSNPFSIAVVYSKHSNSDSIVFRSSSNGGMSFDTRYVIAASSHYFHKVTLAYGRGASQDEGRYFAAWEEQENANSNTGHIYTAHSEPNFNSPFTIPVRLDGIDPSAENKLKNPSIGCQASDYNNDNSNFTEVIFCDKFIPSGQKFDVTGFLNKNATFSDNFQNFKPFPGQNYLVQPDIGFNPYDSTFIATYYDSTLSRLPYVTNDFNMQTPDTWSFLSTGYNDVTNLENPIPKIILDYWKQTGINTWIGETEIGNGIALFDAPYHYYVGTSDMNCSKDESIVHIFPNPATDCTFLDFALTRTENIEINVINNYGMLLGTFKYVQYSPGNHRIKIDLSKYVEGIYFFLFKAGESFETGTIIIAK